MSCGKINTFVDGLRWDEHLSARTPATRGMDISPVVLEGRDLPQRVGAKVSTPATTAIVSRYRLHERDLRRPRQAGVGAWASPGRWGQAAHASVAMISPRKWQRLGHVLNSPFQVVANRDCVARACRNMNFDSVI